MAVNNDIEGIFSARVPLLKFKDSKTNIDCDICLFNTIGIANSKLVRLYCEFDQRVHIMIKYIRFLLKEAGLLASDQGCLSSYSIVMMIIALLQTQDDPVVPNLFSKKSDDSSITFNNVSITKYHKVNVTEVKADFEEDLNEVKKHFSSTNTKSVAQLVVEFFQYYFLRPSDYVFPQIDIRKGGFSSDAADPKPLFDIVEPMLSSSRSGQGCYRDSNHTESYRKFAFDFCQSVIDSA